MIGTVQVAIHQECEDRHMAGPRPILVVDDDEALRETLCEQLALDGEFAPQQAGTAAEALARLSAEDARFDAIMLDIGLPDGDGRELCAKLRKQGLRMPILMLTGADQEQDMVRGPGQPAPTTTSPSPSA